jgi:hypothetical protein
VSPPDRERDGRAEPGFDERALYRVVRHAVEDAILGVLGTLLLLGIAFVVVIFGARVAVSGSSTVAVVAGVAAVGYGVYLAAATLGVVPSVRELL